MKNDDDDHNENIKEIFKNIKERFKFLINITTGGFIMPPDNNYKTIITCDNFNTNIELLQESIHKLVSEKKLDECIKLLWDLYFQIKNLIWLRLVLKLIFAIYSSSMKLAMASPIV